MEKTKIKKRVQFDDDSKDDEQIEEENKLPFNKKFKHTLDSDESDDELENEKKYELKEDELSGEEEGNLHREGEITITPFNLKDELKEGHFDNDGMYIFRKDKDEIKDNWIDNIDWAKIKEVDETKTDKSNDNNDGDKEETTKFDEIECLKGLIELMNPQETVQKAIQRLGKSKLKNANRNKNRQRLKKQSTDGQGTTSSELSKEEQEDNERKDKLNRLIELSNQFLSNGDMDIYETRYEILKYQLKEEEKKKENELDMFAD